MKSMQDIVFDFKATSNEESDLSVAKFCVFLRDYFATEKSLIGKIEAATRLQSESREWALQKSSRITSSSFRQVIVRQKRLSAAGEKIIDNQKLVNKLVKPAAGLIHSQSLTWGRNNEGRAREAYREYAQREHMNFKIHSCGLFVDHNSPFLAASPDGLVSCDCCGAGVLEIKCPYTLKDSDPQLAPYITSDGVDHEHSSGYYQQIQGSMAITGRNYCDFIVWTSKGLLVRRVKYNDVYWRSEMLPHLTAFFSDVLGPVVARIPRLETAVAHSVHRKDRGY